MQEDEDHNSVVFAQLFHFQRCVQYRCSKKSNYLVMGKRSYPLRNVLILIHKEEYPRIRSSKKTYHKNNCGYCSFFFTCLNISSMAGSDFFFINLNLNQKRKKNRARRSTIYLKLYSYVNCQTNKTVMDMLPLVYYYY